MKYLVFLAFFDYIHAGTGKDEKMLDKFYAVTRTSIYEVAAAGEYRATATKVALKDQSSVLVGDDICEGGMIAICRVLQAFIPEKYGMMHPMTGYERQLESVNMSYWGIHSSPIVALFKEHADAARCLAAKNQEPRDPRWLESTKSVLAEIGEEHPSFYISHDQRLALIPEHEAA